MRIFALLASLALIVPTASRAQSSSDGSDILKHLVNNPWPGAVRVNGLRDQPPLRNDSHVQGGKALFVTIPGKSNDAWSIAANTATNKAVEAGDKLVLGIWARLARPGDSPTAKIPYVALQENKEPWTAVIKGELEVGQEWKLHTFEGKSSKRYEPGELAVSLHLATGKHTIAIGPIYVLDMSREPAAAK